MNSMSVSHWQERDIVSSDYAAKSLQSCPTLCNPRDGSPPGSPVPGILQARTLEWVAISFSNAWKWKVKVKSLRLSTWKLHSRVRLLATPWSAVYQAPPSMGFSRQEYWSGVPLFPNSDQPMTPPEYPQIAQTNPQILPEPWLKHSGWVPLWIIDACAKLVMKYFEYHSYISCIGRQVLYQ